MSKIVYSSIVALFMLALIPGQAGAITGSSTMGTTTKPYSVEEMRRLKEERNAALQKEREDLLKKKEEMMKEKKDAVNIFKVQMKNATGTATVTRPDLRDKIKETREEFRDKLQDAREQAKEKMKDVREEFRDARGKQVKARIEAHLERMIRRLEALFNRLTDMADRIDSRIKKIETENKNITTTRAKELLASGRAKITEGKTLLAALPGEFSNIFTNDTSTASSTATTTIKAKVEAAKGKFENVVRVGKEAHALLVDAVASLKSQMSSSTPPTTGTSTATSTNSH